MEKKKISYSQKVWALIKANPGLTVSNACLLLGIKAEDLQKEKIQNSGVQNPLDDLLNIFEQDDQHIY